MISFLKRCWQRRWIRGFAWTVITLATLIALFVVWVNWTGARVWREAQQRVLDEKLTLDFRQTLPDAVPDAENFCATPLLRDIVIVVDRDPEKGEPAARRKVLDALGLPEAKATPSALKRPSMEPKPGQSPQQLMSEWTAWLREMKGVMPVTDTQNPAREVLAALSYQDAAVAEMAARLDRPQAQFQPAPKDRPLPEMLFSMQMPHFSALQRATTGLALRAVAAAHAGETARAHEATRILVRLSQATAEEPFLLGSLVSSAAASQAVSVVSTLCELRAGTGEDFLKLGRDLERLDFHRSALRAWEGELAAGTDAVMYLKRTRDPNLLTVLGPEQGNSSRPLEESIIPRLLPGGLFDMNAANMVHMELDYIIRPLRGEGWQGVLNRQLEMERALKYAKANWPTNMDKIFPTLLMPAAVTFTTKSVYIQTRVNQAIIACALERHYAEHKTYPDSLESLKGPGNTALPVDPANGAPMRYRKTEDGRYKLWSVAVDLRDDGGKAGDGPGGASKSSRFDYKGDWVWEYAASK